MAEDNVVKLLKFINNEELLAEVVETDDDSVTLKNIVAVGFMPNRSTPDQPAIGMAPWVPYRDANTPVTFAAAHIMAVMIPQKEMVEEYKRMFSKLLTPAKSGLILPK